MFIILFQTDLLTNYHISGVFVFAYIEVWVHFCQISRERKKTAASGKSKMKHIEVDMGDPDQVR